MAEMNNEQESPFLASHDDSSDGSFDSGFGIRKHGMSSGKVSIFRLHLPFLIVHCVVFLVYSAIFFYKSYRQDQIPYFRKLPDELSTVSPYIEDQTVVFNSTTFWWTEKDRPVSIYEGPPTSAVEAAWENLMTTGLRVGLTAEENAELPLPSVAAWDDPTVYPVSVSVFHHLHCLNRLRRVAWGSPNPQNETLATVIQHTDHCIEDLRNALMCQPDTTIMPLVYTNWAKNGMPLDYEAIFNIPHTCRNWGRIMDWAAPRGKKIQMLPNMPA